MSHDPEIYIPVGLRDLFFLKEKSIDPVLNYKITSIKSRKTNPLQPLRARN